MFRAANVRLTTSTLATLNRVLRAGQAPYWALRWSLSDDLDVATIVSQAEERAGKHPTSSASVRVGSGPTILTQASFALDTYQGHNIRLDLSRAGEEARAAVSLDYDGVPDRGFYKAHQTLSVSQLMRVLYGEVNYADAHSLIVDACTP
jgi:hypothetical protein